MSTEVMSALQFEQSALGGGFRRGSLGSVYGNPMVQYTSSSTMSNKRTFSVHDDNSDCSGGYATSSPAKRSRTLLKGSKVAIFCDDAVRGYDSDGIVSKRHALSEQKALGSVTSLANSRASAKALVPGSTTIELNGKEPRKMKLSEKRRAPSSSLHKRGVSPEKSPKKIRKRESSKPRPVASKSDPGLLFHKAVERARGVDCAVPRVLSNEAAGGVALALPSALPLPASWKFDIYEDTPDEMMQNLMEHSATVLDISDHSDDEKCRHDEVAYRGKENISPERLAEIMAQREDMELDFKIVVPSSKKTMKEKRNALGEIDIEVLYPVVEAVVEEIAKKVASSPLAMGTKAGEFEVYASEDESERPAAISRNGKGKMTQAVGVESSCGASDKEN
ncbi:hypothetical protein DFH27DRAFT_89864 [Peziza echinospora]|nr:hypothetical protein DFH27DRAFT_89864 [Peziza echinospora]